MTIRDAKAAVHLQEWSQMARQCQESGLTVKEWCSQNDIKPSCYYRRLARVRKAVLAQSSLLPSTSKEQTMPTLVKVNPESIVEKSTSIFESPASQRKPIDASFFRLQYHSATLEIPVGTGAEDIAEVLKAMGQYAI